MSVKMTGAQFKAFWISQWVPDRPNVVVDDWVYLIDGRTIGSDDNSGFDESKVADTAVVKILQGAIYDQDDSDWLGIELPTLARRWLRLQTHVHLIVEVEKDQVERIKALLQNAKAKVLAD